MTKKERKLLDAAARLKQVSDQYLKELTEIDKIISDLPISLSRKYELEANYFEHVPQLATSAVRLSLLHPKLLEALDGDVLGELDSADLSWEDLND